MICISIANDLIITMIVDIYLMGMVCFSDCWFVAWWSDSFRNACFAKRYLSVRYCRECCHYSR